MNKYLHINIYTQVCVFVFLCIYIYTYIHVVGETAGLFYTLGLCNFLFFLECNWCNHKNSYEVQEKWMSTYMRAGRNLKIFITSQRNNIAIRTIMQPQNHQIKSKNVTVVLVGSNLPQLVIRGCFVCVFSAEFICFLWHSLRLTVQVLSRDSRVEAALQRELSGLG